MSRGSIIERANRILRLSSGNLKRLCDQAGSKGDFSAAVITILGLLADFMTPWFTLLSWLFPIVLLVAVYSLYRWSKTSSPPEQHRALRQARLALHTTVAAVVLAPICLLNLISSGDNGFMASEIPVIAELQTGINERFDRLDDALAVLNGKSEAIERKVDTVIDIADQTTTKIDKLSETTEGVANEASATRKTMELSVALQMVDRAKQDRDGSNQGQSLAFESLLSNGYDFQNADLSGVSFRKSQLADGDFSSSKSHFADFSESNLSGVNLSSAGLRFANLGETNASKANLSGAYAPFMRAENADFSEAILKGANFTGADLRNTKFVNADVTGASFAFADLSGADFTGATLDSAYFAGANLSDAVFTNATLSNTNMHGVILDKSALSDTQISNTCRHTTPRDDGFSIKILEQWPSNRYSSGFEFDELNQYKYYGGIPTLASQTLPVCTSAKDLAVGFDISYPAYISMKVDRYYLKNARRRSLLLKQLDEHFALLQKAYAGGPVFNGSGSVSNKLIEAMTKATTCAADASTSNFNSDELLLALLANNLVNPEDVNWQLAAHARLKIERAVDETARGGLSLSLYTLWPDFYPTGTAHSDLPPEAAELFKQWTLCRVKHVDGTLWYRTLAHPGSRSGAPRKDEVLYSGRYGFNYVEKLSDGESYGKFKFGDGEATILSEVKDLGYVKGVAADLRSIGLDGALFVFPSKGYTFALSVPKLKIAPDGADARRVLRKAELRAAFKLTKLTLHGTDKRTALIYLEPGTKQLIDGSKMVHESY
jgi:uncharacterized protein YjbI with pentapeptide repeats